MNLFFREDIYDILCKLYDGERIIGNIRTLKNLEKPRGYSTFRDSTAWCEQVFGVFNLKWKIKKERGILC